MYITGVFIINIKIKLWTMNRAQQIKEERTSLIIITLTYVLTYYGTPT